MLAWLEAKLDLLELMNVPGLTMVNLSERDCFCPDTSAEGASGS